MEPSAGGRDDRIVVCTIVLAVVPMIVLNPMGRSAFLGYYLGVITLWLVFVLAGQFAAAAPESQQ